MKKKKQQRKIHIVLSDATEANTSFLLQAKAQRKWKLKYCFGSAIATQMVKNSWAFKNIYLKRRKRTVFF